MASSPCFSEDEDDKVLEGDCEKDLDALRQACRLSAALSASRSPYSCPSSPEEVEPCVEQWNYSESDEDEELFSAVEKRFGSSFPLFSHQDGPNLTHEEENDDDKILRSVEKRVAALDRLERKIGRKKLEPVKAARKQRDHFVGSVNGLQYGCKALTENTLNPIGNLNSKTSRNMEKGTSHLPTNQIHSASKSSSKYAMKVDVHSRFEMLRDNECILNHTSTIIEESQTEIQTIDLVLPRQLDLFDDSSIGVAEEGSDWGCKDIISVSETAIILSDALRKNRLCQKALRCKLTQVESKLQENKELQKSVRTLIGIEKLCRRRFAGIVEYENNVSARLISISKKKEPMAKGNEFAVPFKALGPPENEDVKSLRMLQKKFPFVFKSRNWSMKERTELTNGVKQQVQESAVRLAMQRMSEAGCLGNAVSLDEQIRALAEKEITATDIHFALPDVNWKDVARIYVVGRTGTECMMRWLNHEDPLINHGSWTKEEDKKLLSISQKHDHCRWDFIAQEVGTNRTAAQCLIRYQRSLNASIIRGAWTVEEDEQLRAAVEFYGELDWLTVAASLEGRTSSQCFNRWHKILHPVRQKSGRWDVEEDKRLRLAIAVYGPRKWRKVASHVPGRTDVQCRERWCNVLDPSLKLEEWTIEEDKKLEVAVSRHGKHHWSLVAIELKPRTDNQCWRRWKALHPEILIEFQKDAQIKKIALINNFVGRSKERPRLVPSDFVSELTASLEFNLPSQKQKQRAQSKNGASDEHSRRRKLHAEALTKKQPLTKKHESSGQKCLSTDINKSTKKRSLNLLRKRGNVSVESAPSELTSSEPITIATERSKRLRKPVQRKEKSSGKPVVKAQISSEGIDIIIGSDSAGLKKKSVGSLGQDTLLGSYGNNICPENNECLLAKNLDDISLDSLLARGVSHEIAKVRREERKRIMKLKRSLGMLPYWNDKPVVKPRLRKKRFVEREHHVVEKRYGDNESDITENDSQTIPRTVRKRRKKTAIPAASLSSHSCKGRKRKNAAHNVSRKSSALAKCRSQRGCKKRKMVELATILQRGDLRGPVTDYDVAKVKTHPNKQQKSTIVSSVNDCGLGSSDSGKRKKAAHYRQSKIASSFDKGDASGNSTDIIETRSGRKLYRNVHVKKIVGENSL